jgi:hypothetical protein
MMCVMPRVHAAPYHLVLVPLNVFARALSAGACACVHSWRITHHNLQREVPCGTPEGCIARVCALSCCLQKLCECVRCAHSL